MDSQLAEGIMVDAAPQTEIADRVGSTDTFTGTVTTTAIDIPSSPTSDIDEMGIRCAIDQPTASRLEYSIDSGTNWIRLAVGEASLNEPRNSIKQIKIRAAGTLPNCKYEIVLNRGPC